MSERKIIPAQPDDANKLSEIAWQAKSYWKYPAKWMELWRLGLTITPKMIETNDVFKLVLDEEIVACIVFITEENVLWIEHLWVLPEYIGLGIGNQLLQTGLKKAVKPLHQSIKVISDLNAENFYKKMGFKTIGQYESLPKGRLLPIMERPITTSTC